MNQYGTNFRAPKVDVHQFSMIPRADIPRSSFMMQHQHKTTINASDLVPIYCQEVLPGDSFNVSMTAYCRLATPLYPIMDNMDLETFFFFVPNRLVWQHWVFMQGEQNFPGDSIAYSVPQVVSPAGGFAQLSIYDYFGLPTAGQVAGGNTISVNALPLRAYNLIWNQWFRDENLNNSTNVGSAGLSPGQLVICASDDGPDNQNIYNLKQVAKRPDYFTTCLPWTQKGNPVTLPLGTAAPVNTRPVSTGFTGHPMTFLTVGGAFPGNFVPTLSGGDGELGYGGLASGATTALIEPNNLWADLSSATASTINAIRSAFQTQRLLERDARGGTRYTEIVRSHFGVISPDARLMRPEYLGGGKSPVTITPVPQTGATGASGTSSPMGTLAAVGTAVTHHGFRQSFTEHGYILGLAAVRRDQIYQQGLKKLWTRLTRYDFYMPVFAMLGEQSVFNREIYCDGSGNDQAIFGYQERWAEYRYNRSFTSGYFRSTNSTPLDAWHLAQKFTALPALNGTFITDETSTVLQRVLAAGASSANQQLLCDFFFSEKVARPMPLYSVPGMIDHF